PVRKMDGVVDGAVDRKFRHVGDGFAVIFKSHADGYRKLLIRITSLVTVPRDNAIDLPSIDSSREKRVSDLRSVNCFIGLPSSGRFQRLTVPVRLSGRVTDLPSADHSGVPNY